MLAAFAPRALGQPAGSAASAAPAVPVEVPAGRAACEAGATVGGADVAFAAYCAGVRAERSLSALSQRYREVWAALPGAARSEFSAAERRWLSSGRYAERDACVAHHEKSGVVHADLVAAECLARVTARRLAQVDARFAATQRERGAR